MNSVSLARGVVTYALVTLSTRFLTLLILPIFSFFLTKAELGKLDAIVITANLMASLISLQIGDAAYRELLTNSDDSQNRVRVLSNTIIAFLLSASFASIFIGIFRFFVAGAPLHIIIPYYITAAVGPTAMQIARGLGKSRVYVVAGVCQAVLTFALSTTLVVAGYASVERILQSFTLASLLTSLYIISSTRIDQLFSWSAIRMDQVAALWKYSLPLVPNIACWWIIGPLNAVLISYFLSYADNGNYAIAGRFAVMLTVIGSIFSLAWQDNALLNKQGDTVKNSQQVFNDYMKFSFSVVVVLIVSSRPLITHFTGPGFEDSWQVTPLQLVASAFSGLCGFLGAGYLVSKRTIGALMSNVAGCIANLLITLITIQSLGLQGAALGTAIGFFLVFIWRYHAQKATFGLKNSFPSYTLVVHLSTTFVTAVVVHFADTLATQLLLCVLAMAFFIHQNRTLIQRALAKQRNENIHELNSTPAVHTK